MYFLTPDAQDNTWVKNNTTYMNKDTQEKRYHKLSYEKAVFPFCVCNITTYCPLWGYISHQCLTQTKPKLMF